MTITNPPIVQSSMLIRKPVNLVFDAFINPTHTVNFWITGSSGPLEENKSVTWEWKMYGASAQVNVIQVISSKLIVFEWGEPTVSVKIEFDSQDIYTRVTITESGYKLEGTELIDKVVDSTGGFTTVLDGLKAYLEHGINLKLISDKHPH